MGFRWPLAWRYKLDSAMRHLAALTRSHMDAKETISVQAREIRILYNTFDLMVRAHETQVDERVALLEAELADVEMARDAARADVETLRKVAFSNDKHVARLKRRLARIKEALEATTFAEDAE